jgi:formyl-CoA transferase
MAEPLQGFRVVELSQGLCGPYAGMLLGDLGADVVKIEPPNGDWLREAGPPCIGEDNAAFVVLNRNKRSAVLDLDDVFGQNAAIDLIRGADVLLVDWPGSVGPAWLAYEKMDQENPRLVYTSISALGEEGPWRDRPVSELEIQGIAGTMAYLGEPGAPPVRLGADAAAMAGGQFACQAVLAALFRRGIDGQGQRLAISQLHALVATYGIMIAACDEPDRWQGFHCVAATSAPDHGFPTQDGHVYFGGPWVDDGSWQRMCHDLGAHELADDPRYATTAARVPRYVEMRRNIRPFFESFTTDEVYEMITRNGAICVVMNDHESLFRHPQVLAMEMAAQVPAPGGSTHGTVGLPWKFTETPGSIRLGSPLLGAHTEELLADAGFKSEAIRNLRASGNVR